MIALIGSEGGQGKRYQAILNYLHQPFIRVDKSLPSYVPPLEKISSAIITTPTPTHIAIVRDLLPLKIPILVEKPFSTDLPALRRFANEVEESGAPISMIMQYRHLLYSRTAGPSHYDYFRHGNDGLVWDCLQIIAFARGPVELREKSPYWDCTINGEILDIGDMDDAYITEIDSFLGGHYLGMREILAIHEKVEAYRCSRG